MKNLLLITSILLASLTSAASGSGGGMSGGGSRPGQSFKMDNLGNQFDLGTKELTNIDNINIESTQIVYQLSQENGVVIFSAGESDGKKWSIKNIKTLETEIKKNPALEKALTESIQFKEWIQLNSK